MSAEGYERTAGRYLLAARLVDGVALAAFAAMVAVLLAGDGRWVGLAAAGLLLAAVAAHMLAWPLRRAAATARWLAMEARWEVPRNDEDARRGRGTP